MRPADQLHDPCPHRSTRRQTGRRSDRPSGHQANNPTNQWTDPSLQSTLPRAVLTCPLAPELCSTASRNMREDRAPRRTSPRPCDLSRRTPRRALRACMSSRSAAATAWTTWRATRARAPHTSPADGAGPAHAHKAWIYMQPPCETGMSLTHKAIGRIHIFRPSRHGIGEPGVADAVVCRSAVLLCCMNVRVRVYKPTCAADALAHAS